MPSWDYLVIRVQDTTVVSVNGQQCCFVPEEQGSQRYFQLHEYLRMIGAEGWEVVASSPSLTGDHGRLDSWTIIARRPQE
jgi:hypothetical protein